MLDSLMISSGDFINKKTKRRLFARSKSPDNCTRCPSPIFNKALQLYHKYVSLPEVPKVPTAPPRPSSSLASTAADCLLHCLMKLFLALSEYEPSSTRVSQSSVSPSSAWRSFTNQIKSSAQ